MAIVNQPKYKSLFVALYSLSNINNPKPVEMLTRMSKLRVSGQSMIISYPRDYWCKRLNVSEKTNHNYDPSSKILTTVINGHTFEDFSIDESMIYQFPDLYFYDSEEILSIGILDDNDFRTSMKIGYTHGIPQVDEWIYISNFPLIPEVIQQVATTPTFFDRVTSISLRYVYGLNETWVYKYRYECIESYSSTVSLVIKDHYDKFKFHGKEISVSGHLINLMTYSCIAPINLRAYLDSVENNLSLTVAGSPITKYSDRDWLDEDVQSFSPRIKRSDMSIEDDVNGSIVERWHEPIEYYLAIVVYLNVAKFFKLSISLRALVYVTRRVKKLMSEFDELKPIT